MSKNLQSTLRGHPSYRVLRELGLTEYEASIYLALVMYGEATAKELSRKSGVPYTRAYDALESLERKGWIEVIEERPLVFRAKAPIDVSELVKDDLRRRMEEIEKVFRDSLQPLYEAKGSERSEFFILRSRGSIASRLESLIDSSTRSLEIMVGLLEPFLKRAIRRAVVKANSGVDVRILIGQQLAGALEGHEGFGVKIKVLPRPVLPINVAISDETRVLFILVAGLSSGGEKRHLAVYVDDQSLARAISGYMDYVWANTL